MAERIRRTVEENTAVTVSLGVSACSGGDAEAGEVIHNADLALYSAKQNGRNRAEQAA